MMDYVGGACSHITDPSSSSPCGLIGSSLKRTEWGLTAVVSAAAMSHVKIEINNMRSFSACYITWVKLCCSYCPRHNKSVSHQRRLNKLAVCWRNVFNTCYNSTGISGLVFRGRHPFYGSTTTFQNGHSLPGSRGEVIIDYLQKTQIRGSWVREEEGP